MVNCVGSCFKISSDHSPSSQFGYTVSYVRAVSVSCCRANRDSPAFAIEPIVMYVIHRRVNRVTVIYRGDSMDLPSLTFLYRLPSSKCRFALICSRIAGVYVVRLRANVDLLSFTADRGRGQAASRMGTWGGGRTEEDRGQEVNRLRAPGPNQVRMRTIHR